MKQARAASLTWPLFAVALVALLAGCATPTRGDAERELRQRVGDRSLGGTGDAGQERIDELVSGPLTAGAAIEIALLRNPRVTAEFARVGLSRADFMEASRLSNPTLSASRVRGGDERKTTVGLVQSLSDLLLLAERRQFGAREYARSRALAAAGLRSLIADAESAWVEAASAQQVARMRAVTAHAAGLSAELAQRFFSAGNISQLQLVQEQAAASRARIESLQAAHEARAARLRLQQVMGLGGEPGFTIASRLPVPPADAPQLESGLAAALQQRTGLAAARQRVALLEAALRTAKRWRWLGHVEIGVERETEPNGDRLTGPTLDLALPIFDQGQAGIARAEAELEAADAERRELEVAVESQVRAAVSRVAMTREVVDEYARTLIEAQRTIVQRQQERQNYMLIGQFELLAAKRDEYDAWQAYLEAVRDQWLARVELASATGAPGAFVAVEAGDASIGVEEMIGDAKESQP